MATFTVDLTGHFCRTITVDVELDEDGRLDDYEIEALAMQEFESTYYPVGQYSYSWDAVEIDGVQEIG